jgi:hypothetical protein
MAKKIIKGGDKGTKLISVLNINVLTLAVIHDGVALPLLITMLNKRGNSHTGERIEIMNRLICLFGKNRIDCLTADTANVLKACLSTI